MLFKCTSTTVTKKLPWVLRNDNVKMCKKYKCKRKGKTVLMFKNQPVRYVGEMEISLQTSYTWTRKNEEFHQ